MTQRLTAVARRVAISGTTHPRRWLWAALCLAVAFRLAVLVAEVSRGDGIDQSESRVHTVAESVASGRGMRLCNQYFPSCARGNDATAQVGPLPVLVLAAAMQLAPSHARIAFVLVQILAGLATIACSYGLARRLHAHPGSAVLAALGLAVYPHLARLELRIGEEPLFTALLCAGMLALARHLDQRTLGTAALAGMLLGAAALCRSALVYFVPILAVALPVLRTIAKRSERPAAHAHPPPALHLALRHLACAAALCAGFAVPLAPWVARGYAAFGSFVPGGTMTGYNLYRHNHVVASPDYLRYVRGDEAADAVAALLARRTDLRGDESEAEMDRVYRTEALRIIAAHPVRYAILSAHRILPLLTEHGVSPTPLPLVWRAIGLAHVALFALAGWVFVERRAARPAALGAVALLLGYYVAGHLLANAKLRYVVPVVPLVAAVAADSARRLGARVIGEDRIAPPPGSGSCE